MLKLNKSSKSLAKAGIISAIYIALTLVLYPISFGAFQVRVSESLTLLPLLFPESIIGLTIGCFISNFFGNGVLDIVFGTLATFLSAVLTFVSTKKIKNDWVKIAVGGIFPVIINAIVIPFTFLALTEQPIIYIINSLQIFVGQFISIYFVGTPLYFICKKINK
jgi:uncharacterized membrane protein